MTTPADMEFAGIMASQEASSVRTPQEKVAILLLALGDPLGAKLLQSFSSIDVKSIMSSASSLGSIDRDDLETLVDDFAAQFAKTLGINTGFENVKGLVERAFTPEQLNSMMRESPYTPHEPIWRNFLGGSENLLVPYFLDEHPQTVAYVLSNLDADTAARCLAMLPREIRDTVAKRLLKLQPVGERPSKLIQDCLQEDLLSNSNSGLEEEGRVRLSTIMNKLDREQSAAIMENLEETRPDEAKILRGMIFSFEDIGKLSPAARLTLFDKVQTEQVIPALQGMPPEIKQTVLSALGARARRMVEAELANSADQISKEGHAARRAIAALALTMAARGEIIMPTTGSA